MPVSIPDPGTYGFSCSNPTKQGQLAEIAPPMELPQHLEFLLLTRTFHTCLGIHHGRWLTQPSTTGRNHSQRTFFILTTFSFFVKNILCSYILLLLVSSIHILPPPNTSSLFLFTSPRVLPFHYLIINPYTFSNFKTLSVSYIETLFSVIYISLLGIADDFTFLS
jgi:hypothetical protein